MYVDEILIECDPDMEVHRLPGFNFPKARVYCFSNTGSYVILLFMPTHTSKPGKLYLLACAVSATLQWCLHLLAILSRSSYMMSRAPTAVASRFPSKTQPMTAMSGLERLDLTLFAIATLEMTANRAVVQTSCADVDVAWHIRIIGLRTRWHKFIIADRPISEPEMSCEEGPLRHSRLSLEGRATRNQALVSFVSSMATLVKQSASGTSRCESSSLDLRLHYRSKQCSDGTMLWMRLKVAGRSSTSTSTKQFR